MGTRSLTVVKEESGEEIMTMYRQMDGYLSGHGYELWDFVKDIRLVNGIPFTPPGVDTPKMANGMGCLAAQIVAHFKTEVGGFYLESSGTRDVGEEYIYILSPKSDRIYLEAIDAYEGNVIVEGFVDSMSSKVFDESPN